MNNYINRGFTLIELIVVIAITAVLSAVILFSVTIYINKGRDANVYGNLSVLVTAGEAYYGGNSNSYAGFCDPTQASGSVLKNVLSQMPTNINGPCYASTLTATTNPQGACCTVATGTNVGLAWVAYAKEFTTPTSMYCVDSRGVKEDIPISGNPGCSCTGNATTCANTNF